MILPAIERASLGVSSRNSLSFSATVDSTVPLTSDETSLSFVCDENFGSGTLTDSTAVRPSRTSSPRRLDFCLLSQPVSVHVLVERSGEGGAKAGKMSAAVPLWNIVREAEDILLIRVVPLHRKLNLDAVALRNDEEHARMDRSLVAVQMLDEGTYSALILEDVLLAGTLVKQLDTYPGVQERQLSESFGQDIVVKRDVRECIGARSKMDDGAPPRRLPDDLQVGFRISMAIDLPVDTAFSVDDELEVLGECVDD